MSVRILHGDATAMLQTLEAGSVQCVVTSPPYYGLRDYGTALWDGGDAACSHVAAGTDRGAREELPKPPAGWAEQAQGYANGRYCTRCGARRIDHQIGLEATPDEYLATMVAVFREVRRVLRDDGTCWVNMGDSYASNGISGLNVSQSSATFHGGIADPRERRSKTVPSGLKPKDLLMMPARLALALQADGWWLRSDIIWAKPNPMPESVTDRPTSAHEHVFLLAKRERYYYDADAVRETSVSDHPSGNGYKRDARLTYADANGARANDEQWQMQTHRSCRNVWTIPTSPYNAAHFATFPAALAERCIKAGSKPGDTILDPFSGAGTTALAADRLGRDAVGIDIKADYNRMARDRIIADLPLFAQVWSQPPARRTADAAG